MSSFIRFVKVLILVYCLVLIFILWGYRQFRKLEETEKENNNKLRLKKQRQTSDDIYRLEPEPDTFQNWTRREQLYYLFSKVNQFKDISQTIADIYRMKIKKIEGMYEKGYDYDTIESNYDEKISDKKQVSNIIILDYNDVQTTSNRSGINAVHINDYNTRHLVAIVIPFRNRSSHLRKLLDHLRWFLNHQNLTNINYKIYLIEQSNTDDFNRAILINIGFVEATRDNPNGIDCLIFHDVDLLPLNTKNIYACHEVYPKHMSSAVDTLSYQPPFETTFGGVGAIPTSVFRRINGMSNLFYGWGGEDDDLYNRIIRYGYKLTRNSNKIGTYRMLKHDKSSPSPNRFQLLNSGKLRYDKDGLSSLQYRIIEKRPPNRFHASKFEYIHILVDFDKTKYLTI